MAADDGHWISHDSGRLINPMVVEGQLHGAVALGLENALFAQIRHDAAGQRLDATLMDYALPRSHDIPPLVIDHLETPSPLNPLGLKGGSRARCRCRPSWRRRWRMRWACGSKRCRSIREC